MEIKVGDKVKVINGSNKGKQGKVLEILRDENRVVIEGVNVVKKHVKPNGQNETGGILEVEASIHISNVKISKEIKERIPNISNLQISKILGINKNTIYKILK